MLRTRTRPVQGRQSLTIPRRYGPAPALLAAQFTNPYKPSPLGKQPLVEALDVGQRVTPADRFPRVQGADETLDERVSAVVKVVHVFFERADLRMSPSHQDFHHIDVVGSHRQV